MTMCLAAATGLAPGVPASAQGAAASKSEDLDQVVVTAERRFKPDDSTAASKLSLPVVETPQALTVLGSEFMEIANLNDTAAVVAYTAGIENNGIGDGTEVAISARGFDIDRKRSFRINGLSVYSEIDLDYFAMDRVEIVRGPASSLYGEADYGATINRVLKKPQDSFGGTFGVKGGSDDYKRMQADVTGPLGGSGLAGRVIGAYQEGGYFVDHTNLKHWLLAPSVSWSNDSTELLLNAYYSKFDGPTSDGFPLVKDSNGNFQEPDVPRNRNYAASTNDIDSSNEFYFGMLTHRFTDSLKLTVGAALSKVDMFNQSSYLCDCDANPGDGSASLFFFAEDKNEKNTSVDVALEKTVEWGGREQRFLVSADWRKEELGKNYAPGGTVANVDFTHTGGPFPFQSPDFNTGNFYDGFTKYTGATLLAYLRPTERIAMLAGARYSKLESGYYEYYFGDYRNQGEDDAIVPRLGVTYRLAEGQYLFGSYSEGIIFNEQALDVNRHPIKPEQGVQYELGIKGEIFRKRLFYSVSAFTIDRTDLATWDPNNLPGLPEVYYNTGRQTHQGLEIELQGEPVPGLNLLFSYAWLDAKIKESAQTGEIGQSPPTSPRNSLSMFATYEVLSGPLKSLTFGGGIVARSKREIDSFGSYSMPAYERVDLRASYRVSAGLTLEANAVNIFNEKIYTAVYGTPLAGNAFTDVRSVTVGAHYKF